MVFRSACGVIQIYARSFRSAERPPSGLLERYDFHHQLPLLACTGDPIAETQVDKSAVDSMSRKCEMQGMQHEKS